MTSSRHRELRLGTISIGAEDPEKLKDFYAAAFNDDLWGRNLTHYDVSFSTWISKGVKLLISSRHHPDDKVMFQVIVDSLSETTTAIEAAGGKLVAGPLDIPMAPEMVDGFSDNFAKLQVGDKSEVTPMMGKVSIYDDLEGNPFGAMELEPWANKLFNGQIDNFERGESALGRAGSEKFNTDNPPS